MDEEAIKRDEKFDGYYAIQTSKKDMDVEEVLGAYHDLWKIEQSFRVMKSCLEVRPDISLYRKQNKRTFCDMFFGIFTAKDIGIYFEEKR